MVRGKGFLIQGSGSGRRTTNANRGGRRSAISTILRKQEALQGQIRALARGGNVSVSPRVRKDAGKRTTRSNTNMSMNRPSLRRGGSSRGGAISAMTNNRRPSGRSRGGDAVSRPAASAPAGATPARGGNRRGGRGGANRRGGRGRAPTTSVADLDAQLDQYMGDDVCKARMDTELDAYFNRAGTEDNKLGGEQAPKP
eukprot:Gregarina_sp_Pseudo_9__2382@NODE_2687_length_911_cov_2_333716_g2464_i0_p3_GENE_NODE_2687_length_911_cov_2_333716_g2464_i0NODE_2687_length_911_cov_2_333716_g2464_i0_p3_ORF_typecomplete_len198_score42_94FoP_duplication/PF13865_6/2_7e03FoP_duplication/PF13865_6/0_02_NODE_2687_length_911_cov_2_333716_g2464_i0135728